MTGHFVEVDLRTYFDEAEGEGMKRAEARKDWTPADCLDNVRLTSALGRAVAVH